MTGATAARAKAGATSIVCGITVKGTLTACQVVEESPRGLGFGQASLRLAPYFRMKPVTPDGQPIDTMAVIIPIRWEGP